MKNDPLARKPLYYMRDVLNTITIVDGDELNVMLCIDEVFNTYAEAFGSHNCVLDMNSPLTVSGDVGLPATLISTMNRWANSHD